MNTSVRNSKIARRYWWRRICTGSWPTAGPGQGPGERKCEISTVVEVGYSFLISYPAGMKGFGGYEYSKIQIRMLEFSDFLILRKNHLSMFHLNPNWPPILNFSLENLIFIELIIDKAINLAHDQASINKEMRKHGLMLKESCWKFWSWPTVFYLLCCWSRKWSRLLIGKSKL